MRCFIFLVLYLVCSVSVFAQGKLWTISGYLRSETGLPVAGATLSWSETAGARADARGHYEIQLADKPEALTVRCIGYFPRKIAMQDAVCSQQRCTLDIVLISQDIALKEVAISAKRLEAIETEDFQKDIIDYDFVGTKMVQILRVRKNHLLRLMDMDKTVLQEIDLPYEPLYFHKSCIGDLHIVGANQAQELIFEGNRIDTFPCYARMRFNQLIEPCVQEAAGTYFYRLYRFNRQSMAYIMFDRDGNQIDFAEFNDTIGIARSETVTADHERGSSFTLKPIGNMPDIGVGILIDGGGPKTGFKGGGGATAAHLMAYETMIQMLKDQPLYAPMLKVRDTLLLFDHLHNRMWRFKAGPSDLHFFPIRYHQEKDWRKELLQDRANNDIYAQFNDREGRLLKRISPVDGSVTATYKVPEVQYLAGNFKIWNGYLFYLAQPDVNIPNFVLYKLRLDRTKMP
jgi:hypothetical protein